jgi:serine/threonine protein kinase
MDFDLLQPMAGAASYRTQPLNVTTHCGTPGYAPLEQYTQGARFGTYTDIYALGATLHHFSPASLLLLQPTEPRTTMVCL